METTSDGRRERSTATRRRLLEAAGPLFAAHGFAGTSLDAIAAAADVNKALVRYHFGGKRGLYSAILREAIATGQELLAPVQQSDAPAGERIGAFIRAIGELLRGRPHFAPMVVQEWMSGGHNLEPEVFAEFITIFQTDREILERGSRAGELRAIDPHATHLSLVGALVFFEVSRPVRARFEHESATPLEAASYLEHLEELYRRGLAP